jgi:hypothetical protein
MAAIWLTPAGNLGTIPESVYYQAQLDAYNSVGGSLTYSLISGRLPSGLTLSTTGMISGIPNAVTTETKNSFTIRITNSAKQVTDRTFSLTVGFILPPVIVPEPGSLGTYVSGNWVDIQLTATEPVGSLTSTFSLYSGELPVGLTLTDTGRIYGYLHPVISDTAGQQSGFDASAYDKYVFDFLGVELSKNYVFSVKAHDGAATDINSFSIFVYSRGSVTADSTYFTADNSTIITTDTSSVYSPVLYTEPGLIGNVRQNAKFAFQFQAEDFNADTITFTAGGNAFPTGLSLSSVTGWLTGIVPYGALGSSTYNFTVNVSKVNKGVTYTSQTRDYSIKLIGRIDNTVNWITSSNIGSIYNGSISELSIQASTTSNKTLFYSLTDHSIGAMPYGLTLLPNGLISGRASFNVTSPSETFTFSVATYDSDNLVYDEKEFTITVVKRDQRPYDNLYIQGFFGRDQRQIYDELINNGDVIPNDYIYRGNDPWFGKNILKRTLFLTGLNPDTMSDFISAMQLNHYQKTLRLGNVKTARALDQNFNVQYEVVYLELIDPYTDLVISNASSGMSDTITTPLSITWPTNTQGVTTVYPNSFTNMVRRLSANIGFQDRSILPTWMTSRQENGQVLGFTRALVLAYVNPGRSAEVAFRVKSNYDGLNTLDYTLDRYLLDSVLSNNFIITPLVGTGNITASTTSANVIELTNMLANSEDFTGWTSSLLSITANTAVAPNGLTTANRLTKSGNGNGYITKTITATKEAMTNSTYTFSVYMQSGSSWTENVALYMTDGNGKVAASNTSVDINGDWNRYSITGTFGSSPAANIKVIIDPVDSILPLGAYTNTWGVDLTWPLIKPAEMPKGAYMNVWGAQLNPGGLADTYQQTGNTVAYNTVSTNFTGLLANSAILYSKQILNMVPTSENFTDWVSNGGLLSITANTDIAPDGNVTADQLAKTANGNGFIFKTITADTMTMANNPYTFSIYMKRGSTWTENIALRIRDGAGITDIASNTAINLTTSWTRYSISGTFGSSPAANIQLYIDPNDLTSMPIGANIQVWGAQLNPASTSGNYYATSGSIASTNVNIGGVSSITSDTALTMFANSAIAVNNTGWLYSNVFIINNFSTGSGLISSNTNSNVVTGQVSYITGSGSISGSSGNNIIIGTSTKFSTQVQPGDKLYSSLSGNLSANVIGTVASITSNTSLRLSDPLSSTISSIGYYADGSTTLFRSEIHHGDVVIANGITLGTVDYISSNTALVLTANAAGNIANVSYTHTARDPYTVPGQGDLYLKFPQVNILA